MGEGKYRQILVVCAANTCRSVMAQWLLGKLLKDRGLGGIRVTSGGIAPFARDGSLVSLEARLVLRQEGIDLPESAASIDLKKHPEMVTSADLILAMTEEQKRVVERMPEACGKEIATFREFGGESGDIGDPFAQGDEVYRRCLAEIKRCAAKIVDRVANSKGRGRGELSSWERLRQRVAYRCRLFSVVEARERFERDGSEHDFYRLELQDWVNVIPLTPDGAVVMVRQYRHGIGGFTLEIPGGLIDPEDNSPLEAARREMLEESGYDSDDLGAIGFVHPNPALQINRCYTFVARAVKQVTVPVCDSTEETEVELVPLAHIPALIRQGKITHALVVAAFQCLDAYRQAAR